MNIRVGILQAPKINYERKEKTFVLKDVRIGIGFHWDRTEDQEFEGDLEIRKIPNPTIPGGRDWEIAINTLDLEDYLCSVISSEMSASGPMELLKAHAIISRSWAIRAMMKPNHEGYDVCADDHCQRYEGIRRMNERAVQAVRSTAGEVLKYHNEICDCRYYKCCGGKTEIWRTCWEDIDVGYIQSVTCDWCKKPSPPILRLVLNDYDQETKDFRDWEVHYSDADLDRIVHEKSGLDFGHIIALEPLHRGASGRIDQLRIIGEKRTEVIGKELKIRTWLSPTCLYSSWVDIRHVNKSWYLSGHGWGHGAGLCQIGAAMMANDGKTYQEILNYYYANTKLSFATTEKE